MNSYNQILTCQLLMWSISVCFDCSNSSQ